MIYYCYRNTQDWEKKDLDLEFFLERKESSIDAQKKQYRIFSNFVKNWNEINDLSYFEFRNILKNISKKTFADSGVQEVLPTNILDLNKKDWIIPFDDDDWFCSLFTNNIEKEERVDFLYGDVVRYFINEGKFEYNAGGHERCKVIQSCQYALKIEKLKEISVESFNNFIKHHYTVKHETVKNKFKYKYLHEIISSRIMHQGQYSMLVKNDFTEKSFVQKKIEFKFYTPPSYGSWCATYIKMLKNSVNKIKLI